MSEQQLEALFDAWWRESYPAAPANRQSRASHVAFAVWLLSQTQAAGAGGHEG